MKKIFLKNLQLILIICVPLIITYIAYIKIFGDRPPKYVPTVTIKYDNSVIPTKWGEFNWGGGSNDFDSSFNIGHSMKPFIANQGHTIKITFSSKPKQIRVLECEQDYKSKLYENFTNIQTCNVTLPQKSGDYIFEVNGYWNDSNCSSNIFHIKIK